jgi:predicted nucleotidyltransferase
VTVASLYDRITGMITLNDIKQKIREHEPVLRDRYKVKRLHLFGSYVRGDQKKKSDADILVEFSGTIDLFTFIELEEYLSSILGVKADLIMKDALKPRIREGILKEAVPV